MPMHKVEAARPERGKVMKTTVYGTNNYEAVYTLPPREAVLAAFALHTMGDPQSWEWRTKYGHLVKKSPQGWVCGNFWASDQIQQ